MKHGWPYSLLNAIAVLLILGGTFGLVSHFGGQFREGYATEFSLVGGTGLVIVGIVFMALGDLGARLVRIETKLGTLPQDEFEESELERFDRAPAQRDPSTQVGKPDTRLNA